MPPEALAGGATLFHEHLSVGFDFMPRVMSEFRTLLGPDAVLPSLPPPEQRRKASRAWLTRAIRIWAGIYFPEAAVAEIRDADRRRDRVLHPATQSTLHGIFVDNPRRFLAFIPKIPRSA